MTRTILASTQKRLSETAVIGVGHSKKKKSKKGPLSLRGPRNVLQDKKDAIFDEVTKASDNIERIIRGRRTKLPSAINTNLEQLFKKFLDDLENTVDQFHQKNDTKEDE